MHRLLLCFVAFSAFFVVTVHSKRAVAEKPHLVFVIGEKEYETKTTLPKFAKSELEEKLGYRCTFVHADENDKNNFPGIEAVRDADLLVLSVRRRSLPEKQLDILREYIGGGNPLVGIRTASHAFDTRGNHPDGHAEWPTFDPDVLGGNYTGHHGNQLKTTVTVIPSATEHPILAGISAKPFVAGGSLYKVSPLAKSCTPLLSGRIEGADAEPVAWTNTYKKGRVFYTSLGHPKDFEIDSFRRMFTNAILWGLDELPAGQ